ncbi:MAG: hypothetical protein NTT76_11985 [Achromobacter xylosoxidans]|nr:hypothetical protein [Achromobacter xylosoxidans]
MGIFEADGPDDFEQAGQYKDDPGYDDSYLKGVVPGLMRLRQWPMPSLPMANAAMSRPAQQRAVPSRQKL